MTTREKQRAKKEKINEIILAPFQTVFPYKDECISWEVVTKKKVAIRIKNWFNVDFFCIGLVNLSHDDFVYFPIDFDFTNKDKINISHKAIQHCLKKHYALLESWEHLSKINLEEEPLFLKNLRTHIEIMENVENESMERLCTDTTNEPTQSK